MLIKKFEYQVNVSPHEPALKMGERMLSYTGLNALANRIASGLWDGWTKNKGCESETVALLFNHGIDIVAAIIAVLKLGKTYVPLSPDFPRPRLKHIIADSQALTILTDRENVHLAGELNQADNLFILDSTNLTADTGAEDSCLWENPGDLVCTEDKPAYILYTSGTTGKPKGVVQNHGNVWHFVSQYIKKLSIGPRDNLTLISACTHDASIMDIFSSLLSGATLYPLDIKTQSHLISGSGWFKDENITIWHSVPSVYRLFSTAVKEGEEIPCLRYIVLGGEKVNPGDINTCRAKFPETTLYNLYGQTESTYNAGMFYPPSTPIDKITIGDPIPGVDLLIIDEDGNEADPLEVGEIVVAGNYVSPGYWQDKELTDKSFTDDPDLGRLYWTGDLGRMMLDGCIEYEGRKDFQVKIRGNRVEPGEIEAALLEHEDVREAVVVAKEDKRGIMNLYCYIVTNKPVTVSDLRNFLNLQLPTYMLPSYFRILDKLPLTAHGKLDRNALPDPESDGRPLNTNFESPKTGVEKKIAEIWKHVLHLDEVGIHDNFFEIGGSSLDIIQVNHQIGDRLKKEFPVIKLFRYPTINSLANYVEQEGAKPGLLDNNQRIAAISSGRNMLKRRQQRKRNV